MNKINPLITSMHSRIKPKLAEIGQLYKKPVQHISKYRQVLTKFLNLIFY
jgi:hypothetical protein